MRTIPHRAASTLGVGGGCPGRRAARQVRALSARRPTGIGAKRWALGCIYGDAYSGGRNREGETCARHTDGEEADGRWRCPAPLCRWAVGGELPYPPKYMRGAPIGPRNATPPREYVAASLGSPGEKIRAKRPNSTVLRPMGHRMWAIGDPKISAFDEKTAASEISPRARPDIYLQWCLTLLEM